MSNNASTAPQSPDVSATPAAAAGPSPAWVSTTYFAEGLPYMLVRFLPSVYLIDLGAGEQLLGRLNWLGLPWNFKFLWAPLLDSSSTPRRWLLGVQGVVVALALALAGVVALGPASGTLKDWPLDQPLPWTVSAFIALVGVFAVASATHDVAIDGYYIAALPDKGEQARLSGLRITAYRGAVLFAKFVLVALGSWVYGFGAGAVTMLAIWIYHLWAAPQTGRKATHRNGAAHYWAAFRDYLSQPRAAVVVAFVCLYKLGDEILFSLNSTFLIRELGMTKAQLGWLSGAVGTITAIAGASLGGWYVARVGLRRALWPLTLMMNVNIWAYAYLAWARPSAQTLGGLVTIAVIHGWEQIAAGLGGAALTVFLLRTCRPGHGAAHYAIGSALMSIGGTFIGGFAGDVKQAVGYLGLFALAFAASIPSMLLIPLLPPTTLDPASDPKS